MNLKTIINNIESWNLLPSQVTNNLLVEILTISDLSEKVRKDIEKQLNK